MKQWNVGIVGLSRGRKLSQVFGAHPRVKVTALCDLDENLLADLGEVFGLDDGALFTDFDAFLGADMDIVIIATPIPLHAEQTIKSLESGRHVLCEQTAAYTIEECGQIVDAVRRTGRKYMMAENYCYFHYIREWKKIIDEGRLGTIFYAEAEYIHEIEDLMIDEKTGKFYWRHARPPIWYCAHCLGPVLTLMNDRIVAASGSHAGFHKHPELSDHPGFLDMEVGLFRTETGALIKILRSQVAPRYPHMVYYSLYGTNGYIENGREGGGPATKGFLYVEGETARTPSGGRRAERITCTTVDPSAPDEAKMGGHGTSEYFMIRDFLDSIERDTTPPIDVIRAMDFTVPGIIAHESAISDGGWREVPRFE